MRIWARKREITVMMMKIVMIGLTALALIKSIWVSLDIDESYAVALGYRLVRGDRLIKDMWEPHQFSAFLAAFFEAPFIWIRGNADYLVVYLRITGILIHVALGVVLYRTLVKNMDRFFAFAVMIVHINFLPKWIQMPEFELMHYWCLLSIFIVLYAYYTGRGTGRFLPVLGGCLYVCCILCYPTMFLLYPFYVLAMCLLERQYCGARGKKVWKSCCLFTMGSFLSGAAFLVYLFSYMSFDELRRYISYIFLDASHGTYTMSEKWAFYLEQLQEQWKGNNLLPAFGIVFAIYLIYWIVSNRHGQIGGGNCLCLPTLIAALLLGGLLMQMQAVYGFLFEDKNQFFMQIRYMAILLPAMILGIRYHRHMSLWLYLCVIPGFLSVAAVLFVTNMDTNVTYAKAFLGVLGSLLIFYQYGKENIKDVFWKKFITILYRALAGALLVGSWVCRLVLIRVSGCLPVTVLAPMERMEEGPAKGIFVLADTAEIWNDNYRKLSNVIDKEDKVLYIGAENLVYVGMDALLSTPSTQGTTVYNEMFLYYYEEHPDRIPDVVVFDKTYAEDPVYALWYGLSVQSHVLFQWVEENYGDGQVIETDYMIILRKP